MIFDRISSVAVMIFGVAPIMLVAFFVTLKLRPSFIIQLAAAYKAERP
jgi:hypothetical protein